MFVGQIHQKTGGGRSKSKNKGVKEGKRNSQKRKFLPQEYRTYMYLLKVKYLSSQKNHVLHSPASQPSSGVVGKENTRTATPALLICPHCLSQCSYTHIYPVICPHFLYQCQLQARQHEMS